jgi:hypothetical protein
MDGMNQLGDILCWRETRRVSQQLVVHYSRMKFTLHPSEITARLVGQAVEVYDFPDGRLEIRWKGLCLPYAVFDKLQRVSHAAIVENKRLGEGTSAGRHGLAARAPAHDGGQRCARCFCPPEGVSSGHVGGVRACSLLKRGSSGRMRALSLKPCQTAPPLWSDR